MAADEEWISEITKQSNAIIQQVKTTEFILKKSFFFFFFQIENVIFNFSISIL